MKILRSITLFVSALCAFFISGCVSAPHAQISPEQGAAAVRVLVSGSATITLSKNPNYAPVAAALAAGIDAAISDGKDITPESISSFVHIVAANHHLSAPDAAVFTNLAISVYQLYVATYKPAVVKAADPRVLLYVQAFKDGLNDAVAAVVIAQNP